MKCIYLLPVLIAYCTGVAIINAVDSDVNPAIMARRVLNLADWATIGTISPIESVKDYPIANLKSISDGPLFGGKGTPYIVLSRTDYTGIAIKKNKFVSLSVSLAQTDYCTRLVWEAQDPRCVQVFFDGTISEIPDNDPTYTSVLSIIKARHPNLLIDHDDYIGKMNIEAIAILDGFGGPKNPSVTDYYNVQTEQLRTSSSISGQSYKEQTRRKSEQFSEKLPWYFLFIKKAMQNAKIARRLVNVLDWGSVTSMRTSDADNLPQNSIVSITDGNGLNSTGIPYIYVSPFEELAKNVEKDPRISLMVTVAEKPYCGDAGIDSADPNCARVILTGQFRALKNTTEEYQFAQDNFFNRHPGMSHLPDSHHFFFAALDIEYIQLFLGQPEPVVIPISDYFAISSS